jgi:hypothetical protein
MRRDGNATEPTAAERTGFAPAQDEINPGCAAVRPLRELLSSGEFIDASSVREHALLLHCAFPAGDTGDPTR